MFKKLSIKEKIFQIIIVIIMICIIVGVVYPFWYILTGSFSDVSSLAGNYGPRLLPKGFSMEAYKYIFGYEKFWVYYKNTIFYVVIGSIVNVAITVFAAFALTRKGLKGRKTLLFITVLALCFNCGGFQIYTLYRVMGLLGSRWLLIINGALNLYCFVILYLAFKSVPQELEESAKIDGTNQFHVLRYIGLPICMPFVIVILMYYSLGRWNDYFSALLYITDHSKQPLQLLLRNVTSGVIMSSSSSNTDMVIERAYSKTLTYASIILSVIPIFIIYPYLQKYFVKGVLIGSLKG